MNVQIKKLFKENLRVGENDSYYVGDLGYQIEGLHQKLNQLGLIEKTLDEDKIVQGDTIKVSWRASIHYLNDLANLIDEWIGTYHVELRGIFSRENTYAFVGASNNTYISHLLFRSLFKSLKRARKEHTNRFSKRMKRTNKIKKADEFCSYWVEQLGYSVGVKNGSSADYDLLHKYVERGCNSIQ